MKDSYKDTPSSPTRGETAPRREFFHQSPGFSVNSLEVSGIQVLIRT
jgi:hypothetical protein